MKDYDLIGRVTDIISFCRVLPHTREGFRPPICFLFSHRVKRTMHPATFLPAARPLVPQKINAARDRIASQFLQRADASIPEYSHVMEMKWRCPICRTPTDSESSPRFSFLQRALPPHRSRQLVESEKYKISEPVIDESVPEETQAIRASAARCR